MRSQTTAAPDAARNRGRRKDPPGNPAARPRGRQTDVEPPPQPPAAAGSAETRHAESERIPPNHSARKRHVRSRRARPRGRDGSGGIFCASKRSSPAAGAGAGPGIAEEALTASGESGSPLRKQRLEGCLKHRTKTNEEWSVRQLAAGRTGKSGNWITQPQSRRHQRW